ncbi:MAG: integrase arm-type DNA-binding domain-containing protein [Casimicrobiaceae bacterium]
MDSSNIVEKFTETFCSRATPGQKPQRLYWEKLTPGFGLRVGGRAKAFFVQRKIDGKSVRVTIGRYPLKKVEDARREAKAQLVLMEAGTNPKAERRRQKVTGMTLRDAFDLYASGTVRDARTIADYKYQLEKYLSDWLDRPLKELGSDAGREDVHKRHRQIARDVAAGKYAARTAKGKPRPHKGRTGETTANHVMHAFRTVWNRAMKQSSALPVCPTLNVDWFQYEPRRAAVPYELLPKWYTGVRAAAPERRDLLLTIILTGLRSNDARTLLWEHIDLDGRKLHITEPKGGKKRAFDLPLSRRLVALLNERREAHEEALRKKLLPTHAAPWTFGAWSASGHIVEVRVPVAGVPYIVHGLRNTFANVGRAAGVDEVYIGTLMNHTQPSRTMTQRYGKVDVDELRAPAQKIEDAFFALFEPTPAKVLPMRRKKQA